MTVDARPSPTMSILFVCEGNTCRSVMAEYLAREKFRVRIRVASAGLAPQAVDDAKSAISALQTFGIDASGQVPRGVGDVNLESFDLVIAMAKSVAARLPAVPAAKLKTWKISDPWIGALPEDYTKCARQIIRGTRKARAVRNSQPASTALSNSGLHLAAGFAGDR